MARAVLVLKSIALIGCPNGLGHVRRVCALSEQFAKDGWQATIFAPRAKLARAIQVLAIEPKALLYDFDAKFDIASLGQGLSKAVWWEKRLPSLDKFDVVLSDNLPEILRLRKDAVLSGNFFWHEVLPNISSEYRARAVRLIRECNPLLLSYGGFSVIQDSSAVQVRDCAIPTVQMSRGVTTPRQKCLLVTSGTTDHGAVDGKAILDTLVRAGIAPFAKVFVEPNLLRGINHPDLCPADFSREMFIDVVATIGRPGFGAITDCFCYSSKFFAVVSEQNHEMAWNAARLKDKGLGESYLQASEAVQDAKRYAADKTQQHVFQTNFKKFSKINSNLPSAVDVIREWQNSETTLSD